MSLKILLNGAKGRMGQAIVAVAGETDASIVHSCDVGDDPAEGIEGCEVVIDFSFHEATPAIARLAAEHSRPLVIGTTGHTAEEREVILDTVKDAIPVVWAGNYSVGVNLLNHLTRTAARILGEAYEPEIVELHHHDKKDAPSGTAERLIDILREVRDLGTGEVTHGREGLVGARPRRQIGVHAIRGGDIVGDHTVLFCGQGERIELTHRATDRTIFARGALRAARWVLGREPGVYSMESVLGLGTSNPSAENPSTL